MGFHKNEHNDYQYAKDIQRLEDQNVIQMSVNKKFGKAIRTNGLGLVSLSIAGFLVLRLMNDLVDRIKILEEKINKTEKSEENEG